MAPEGSRSVPAEGGAESFFQPLAEAGGHGEAAAVAGKLDDVAGAVEDGGAVRAGAEMLRQDFAFGGADLVLDVVGEQLPDLAAADADWFRQASLFPAPRSKSDGSLAHTACRRIPWLGRGIEMAVLATSNLFRADPLTTMDTNDLLLHGVLHPCLDASVVGGTDPSDGIPGGSGSYNKPYRIWMSFRTQELDETIAAPPHLTGG